MRSSTGQILFLIFLLAMVFIGYYLVDIFEIGRDRRHIETFSHPKSQPLTDGNEKPAETYGIIYCSKEETAKIICDSDDNYFETFTETDFRVRKCPKPSIDLYKARIKGQTCDLDNFEDKKKLDECIIEADLFFLSTKFRLSEKCSVENGGWIDPDKMTQLPWKIGFIGPPDTDGFHYEGGLPHTRDKTTIILPLKVVKMTDKRRLTSLLIHEKCHVYQKVYPESCELYIADRLGYSKSRSRHSDRDKQIRANPDIDEFIYKDNATGKEICAIYEDDARHITDILPPACDDQRFEHPFEEMAIAVEEVSNLQSELWVRH